MTVFINAPHQPVTKAFIDDLVENSIPESRDLDYKQSYEPKDKRVFLADIASYANSIGGIILYGIEEERDANGKPTGHPNKVIGITLPENPDQFILRIENTIRSGITPRIPEYHIDIIDGLPDDRVVVAIRVKRSWNGPHMLVVDDRVNKQFYARSSNGNYQLDYGQLRDAFLQSVSFHERIRRFQCERIASIVNDDMPAILNEYPKVVFHIIPYSSMDSEQSTDFARVMANQAYEMRPIGRQSSPSSRYNIDGFLNVGGKYGYVQIFRNGIVEAVDVEIAEPHPLQDGIKALPSGTLVTHISEAFQRYITVMRDSGVSTPIAVSLSLTGFAGVVLATRRNDWFYFRSYAIDRDIVIPEFVVMDEYPEDIYAALQPVFDYVWQAAGWERCFDYYDEAGKWKP